MYTKRSPIGLKIQVRSPFVRLSETSGGLASAWCCHRDQSKNEVGGEKERVKHLGIEQLARRTVPWQD
ncbi:hypothetical protein PoB_005660000 [Plakobranchus ocellatus]|uniref:Uncharacterized protein n=1 Tax=Plakobranchus ocellatus TaxID=259542 RepID=A0AAV4CEG9_9GAST|nr:hypothetical protein PoB_005660000 [Plakobranchus ocellatus]